MSNCYKNFPVKINYSSGPPDVIYGNSTSLSENIALEHADSIGVKGSNAVFNNSIPKGDLSVDSYLIDDLNIFNNLKGSNDQSITIDFGPYRCPAPCILSSMSINIAIGEPLTVQRSFNYFGSVTSTNSPTPIITGLQPVIPENIGLSGFDQLGDTANITSINWQFSQNYNEHYLLGELTPYITFGRGEISIDIDGEGMSNPLVSEACVVPPKDYGITVSGCGGEDLGTLLVNGYMQNRSSAVSSESNEENSVSIIQYL
tara:strand:- start:1222 stop:1998 length:777 start_codon:yes stop_codon:yes gene_type:complete